MIGCLLSVVCTGLIGAVWYNSALPFGKVWMRKTFPGKSAKDVGNQGRMALGLSIVSSLFMSLLLRFILVDFFKMKTIIDAMKFTIGLASMTAMLEFPHAAFSQRPFDIFIIDQLYNLVVMAVAAACIFYLP